MTEDTSTAPAVQAAVTAAGGARPDRAAVPGRYRSWIPGWGLITTKHLELRKRRGLMVVAVLLTVGLPVLVLGIRLLFHVADPKSYGPAGSPSVFQFLCQPMAEFGFTADDVGLACAAARQAKGKAVGHLRSSAKFYAWVFINRMLVGAQLMATFS